MEWQLEELDKQLEELKQQATPKFRLALQLIVTFMVFVNSCGNHEIATMLLELFGFRDIVVNPTQIHKSSVT